jgi:hypothetical protein
MEDASAVVDLDWFLDWFYSTDFVDIGISDVKHFVSETASQKN